MNMVKLNNKLTAQVIDIVNTFNTYKGITEDNSLWTYHRENGAEVVDIDFRLKITDSGLMVIINKSYDKDTISGGHYTEDTQAELEPSALDIWLEDNGIFTKKHTFQQIKCTKWSDTSVYGLRLKRTFTTLYTKCIIKVLAKCQQQFKFYLKSCLI